MSTATLTASDLRAAHLADLDALARRSAEQLAEQGWDPTASAYDIGDFPGDLEAAEDYAGRRFDREETKEHEARIRAHLARLFA